MSATDRVITLVGLMKLEAPGGDVNLCDGAFVYFDAGSGSERYTSQHAVFGSLGDPEPFDSGFGDSAEGWSLTLVPNPVADLGDWYRADLRDSRVRFWLGEVDPDGKTVSSSELVADMLVDVPSRVIAADGSVTLELDLISRGERLFLVNEGNVASERFHKSIWSGENGFNNCTDVPIPVAWGVAGPTAGVGGGGGRVDPNAPKPQLY